MCSAFETWLRFQPRHDHRLSEPTEALKIIRSSNIDGFSPPLSILICFDSSSSSALNAGRLYGPVLELFSHYTFSSGEFISFKILIIIHTPKIPKSVSLLWTRFMYFPLLNQHLYLAASGSSDIRSALIIFPSEWLLLRLLLLTVSHFRKLAQKLSSHSLSF